MSTVALTPSRQGYLSKLLTDLLSCGWTIDAVPASAVIPRNRLRLVLRAKTTETRLRVFAYKVTTSGRKRPHERRVEITTTYHSGLKPLRQFKDVVLGIDVASGIYVGVDSRRLRIGGTTHNASSFFDLEGLSVKSGNLLINPRSAHSDAFPSGIELHAFFDRTRLSEYLLNYQEIHSGLYAFGGALSGPMKTEQVSLPSEVDGDLANGRDFVLSTKAKSRKTTVSRALIEAAEKRDLGKLARRQISPEKLKQILAICDEVGAIGEQAVLNHERKRLRRLGFTEQAKKVERVSLRSVGEGYDIVSFEDDGITKRYLEVKATIGKGFVVDVSRGEWRAAKEHGDSYYLVRVISAKNSPALYFIRNPARLEEEGLVERSPIGWKIDLRKALKV